MNGARQRIPFGQVPAGLGVGVVVPAEVERLARLRGQRVDDDHAGPGLGQPPGEQAALSPQVPAVAVAKLRVFLASGRTRRAIAGLVSMRSAAVAQLVGPLQRAVAVDVAAQAVEVGEQAAALAELLESSRRPPG